MRPNVERNREIVEKRNAGWSFRKLAKHFRLHVSNVHEIYHRDKDEYSKGVQSYPQKRH